MIDGKVECAIVTTSRPMQWIRTPRSVPCLKLCVDRLLCAAAGHLVARPRLICCVNSDHWSTPTSTCHSATGWSAAYKSVVSVGLHERQSSMIYHWITISFSTKYRETVPYSPLHSLVNPSLSSSPLSASISPSFFHSRLKIYLFNKSFLTFLLYSLNCLHSNGTGPDLSWSSVYFFVFLIHFFCSFRVLD